MPNYGYYRKYTFVIQFQFNIHAYSVIKYHTGKFDVRELNISHLAFGRIISKHSTFRDFLVQTQDCFLALLELE